MTTTAPDLTVRAIDPSFLESIRTADTDGHGNQVVPFPASGGEPLRCCLRRAYADETIALISYAPFEQRSVWREVGPVYIHAEACAGFNGVFPIELCDGPRLLRTYRADRTMNYDHNTPVDDGADVERLVDRLLTEPEVALVHVRTLVPQCFLFEVRAQN